MNRITINGNTFSVEGNNISIINGKVISDGNVMITTINGYSHIIWEGPLANLTTDSSVTCGDVSGNVFAGGSIKAGDINGSVNAGGSVKASGHLGGSISAGGSVNIS